MPHPSSIPTLAPAADSSTATDTESELRRAYYIGKAAGRLEGFAAGMAAASRAYAFWTGYPKRRRAALLASHRNPTGRHPA